jgi:hypothetical protein
MLCAKPADRPTSKKIMFIRGSSTRDAAIYPIRIKAIYGH